jgi:hypothetical protein
MMKTVTVVDVPDGLATLLDKRVLLLCSNYFYDGLLVGVNDTCVRLADAFLVYETGAWDAMGYQDAQRLPSDVYVQIQAIEAYLISGKAV